MYRLIDETPFAAMRRRVVQAVFADRELMIRSGGRIRYVNVTRVPQIVVFTLFAAAIGWVGYSSLAYFRLSMDVAEKDRRIALAYVVNAELRQDMDDTRRRFLAIAGTLEKNHGQLETLVSQNRSLRGNLVVTKKMLETAETKRQLTEARTDSLRKHLSALEDQVLATTNRNETLASNLQSAQSKLHAAVADRLRAQERGKALADHVTKLRGRLSSVQTSQNTLLKRLTKAAAGDIDRVRTLIAKTGLKVEDLLARREKDGASARGEDGKGGPFVPADGAVALASFDDGLEAFNAQMDRWQQVQRLVRRVPLITPVRQYRISSRYGQRRDPVNGRRAFHSGLDMAGPMRQKVRTTAHGRVVRAGRYGRYGRFIEIDHGGGIRTRYGHLAKIVVEKGQELRSGDIIGLLGSSGRSTGPHLHYEITIDGKLVDPLKFLKVGKHVFKS